MASLDNGQVSLFITNFNVQITFSFLGDLLMGLKKLTHKLERGIPSM